MGNLRSKIERTAAFSAHALSDILFNDFALAENTQFIVAYSGGCDSQVLLHGLVALRKQSDITVIAAHFDHGLQAQSVRWAKQCQCWCDESETHFISLRGTVDCGRGESVEACARDARYRWLDKISQPPQVVVSAHHADDQAETFLLHLFQGKEIEQLAGIAPTRPLVYGSQTMLIRPLLGFSRTQLVDYARLNKLQWIDDPMNHDLRFYRNYIRHALMPILCQRSPNMVNALNRATNTCRRIAKRERIELLAFHKRCCYPKSSSVFCLTAPLNMTQCERQCNKSQLIGLIRYWIHNAGYASPTNGQLTTLYEQIVEQQATQATLSFNGLVVRYYHHHLYLTPLMPPRTCLNLSWEVNRAMPCDTRTMHIVDYGIVVTMNRVTSAGLSLHALQGEKIQLRWRQKSGVGEHVRQHHRRHHCALKKLFQVYHVPPWERDYLPFLVIDDDIVWVHGIGVLGEYAADSGYMGYCPQFSYTND